MNMADTVIIVSTTIDLVHLLAFSNSRHSSHNGVDNTRSLSPISDLRLQVHEHFRLIPLTLCVWITKQAEPVNRIVRNRTSSTDSINRWTFLNCFRLCSNTCLCIFCPFVFVALVVIVIKLHVYSPRICET